MSETLITLPGRYAIDGRAAAGPLTITAFHGGQADGPCLQFTSNGTYSQLTVADVLKLQAAVERWVREHNVPREEQIPRPLPELNLRDHSELVASNARDAAKELQELREHTQALQKCVEERNAEIIRRGADIERQATEINGLRRRVLALQRNDEITALAVDILKEGGSDIDRETPLQVACRVVMDDFKTGQTRLQVALHDLNSIRSMANASTTIMDGKGIPMLLFCPGCGGRHIDSGEFAKKSHHTHACQGCGFVWRPALVDTVGVQFLPGFKDGES